ncbi:hypothetical protein ABDD95_22280 [Mucilaginibacter sp. PAMB04274]
MLTNKKFKQLLSQAPSVQYGNVNYTNKSQYDSRNIRLNVTYNFGNSR